MSLILSKNEKISLSFSKRDLQMFLYSDSKNSLSKKPSLSSRSSLFSEFMMDYTNRFLKKSREY